MYFCFLVICYVCYMFSKFLRHHIILFFSSFVDKTQNSPRTWRWPCISSTRAAPFVSHVQQKCTESLFWVWVCARMCKSWLTGCVGVLTLSPRCRWAGEVDPRLRGNYSTSHLTAPGMEQHIFIYLCVLVCVSVSECFKRGEKLNF